MLSRPPQSSGDLSRVSGSATPTPALAGKQAANLYLDGDTIYLRGPWVTDNVQTLLTSVETHFNERHARTIDASGITKLDTAGAWLLLRLLKCGKEPEQERTIVSLASSYAPLLQLVRDQDLRLVSHNDAPSTWLEQIGRRAWPYVLELTEFLGFIGEATVASLRALRHPQQIRWRALAGAIEEAGVRAVPIVGLLSFLLGVVIAYQGSIQLRSYGANIFIVELVTLTIVRELGPMMTAIIIAGRTGSAYTAEIGTMQVSQEIDALKSLSMAPMDVLVLPRVLGLLIALPLLTMVADALGVAGGMVIASTMLDVDYQDFLYRIPLVVPLDSFLVGLVKAPAFATIVALMGCFQGLHVKGGADAVGRQTTVSVVQSIFLVIVVDAAFSILFGWLKV